MPKKKEKRNPFLDMKEMKFDLRKKPVTDSAVNSRLILPSELEPREESQKNIRIEVYIKGLREHLKNETKEGKQ